MRAVGILLGLVVAGATAVGASVLRPGPKPTLLIAGAGLLGTGVVGLAVETIDAIVERRQLATPFSRGHDGRNGENRGGGLSKADRLVIALGAGAVFVRVGLVRLVADPLRIDGAVLTALAVAAVGVVVGYRTADGLLTGLRHGVLACGLGGALCVSLAAYDATTVAASPGAFDAMVAGSGLVLPVAFGLFGGLSGAVGWWLADRLAGADPLA
jgi:hypothetical protein